MNIVGAIALLACCAVLYCSWSVLVFIYKFFVNFFVFVGMVCFIGLLCLLFIGSAMGLVSMSNSNLANIAPGPSVVKNTIDINPPYGIPVPFKKGFIRSPYDGCKKGIIDARGIAPNTMIRDPYSGKIILMP